MITYKSITKVYLDRKPIGEIRADKLTGLYHYHLKKNLKDRGDGFRTLELCQKSLEG